MVSGRDTSADVLALAEAAIELLYANKEHIPAFRSGKFRDNVAKHLPIGKQAVDDIRSGKISAEKRRSIEQQKRRKKSHSHRHRLTLEQKAKHVSTDAHPNGWDIIDAARTIIRVHMHHII